MRIANADPDWSEDTATLIYDPPGGQSDAPRLYVAAESEAPRRARSRVPTFSGGQIVMIITAALIGAMGGAWSIAEQAQRTVRVAEPRATPLAARPQAERAAAPVAAAPAPVVADPAAAAPAAAAPVAAAAGPVAAAPAPVVAAKPALPVEAEPTPAVAKPAPVVAKPAPVVAKPAPVVAKPAPVVAVAARPAVQDRRKQRTAARTRTPRATPTRSSVARSEPAPAAAAPPAQPAVARMGRLRINSRPWSKIFIDGRPAGNTPQASIEVKPGLHTIALISDEFDLKRTITIDVRPGETVTRSVELLQ
jgi:hypothetical protein